MNLFDDLMGVYFYIKVESSYISKSYLLHMVDPASTNQSVRAKLLFLLGTVACL